MATITATTTATPASNRRNQRRYVRSSTTASVTQLLSDSCNSILQRFRRVPSEKLTGDKPLSLLPVNNQR